MTDRSKPTLIAWIDAETLGSNKPDTPIIELAIAITDTRLRIRHQKSWIFPQALYNNASLLTIDPDVIEMHAKNGLWRDLINALARGNPSTKAIQDQIMAWLNHNTHYPDKHSLLVGGSGFDHFDRPIIEKQFPALAEIIRYYSLDIGSAERLMEIVGGFPRENNHPTDHRAITCVTTQIARARDHVGVIQRALGTRVENNVLYEPPND